MDFVAVAIVSAIVLGHSVQQKRRILIGLNCILLCLNNSSQIAKINLNQRNTAKQYTFCSFILGARNSLVLI